MKNFLNELKLPQSHALYYKVQAAEYTTRRSGGSAERRRLVVNFLAALCRDAAPEELGR